MFGRIDEVGEFFVDNLLYKLYIVSTIIGKIFITSYNK